MHRTLVVGFLALALLTAAACGSPAADPGARAGRTVKVGIILTYSGADASIGEAIDRGAELYLALHRQDLPPGVRIELVKRDETGPSPEVARRLAQELLVRE